MREKQLLVYRNLSQENRQLLSDMVMLIETGEDTEITRDDKKEVYYRCVHDLLEMAGNYGFYGNLWHCFLADVLVNDENSYSKACEVVGSIDGSINDAVLHDMEIFLKFLSYDFEPAARQLGSAEWDLITHYVGSTEKSKVYNIRIQKRICNLAEKFGEISSPQELKDTLTEFYKEYGVGKFGLHKAFRVSHGEGGVQIVPITNIAHVHLDDLVGYELQKKKLVENTQAFINGKKANNCLLFGDAGTGKSSCIKAITNEFYDKGLRIIEVYKHQFQDLNEVIAQIKNRNYKFIIYMDDLSFEEFEIEYKYLKAVIEGGLEKKPGNVLIYATSNRRHLIREKSSDKNDRDEDLHTNDTVQEKLSLAYRFGVTIFFGKPEPKEFQNIVCTLAERHHINMDESRLLSEANKWELSHGGISGRTAQQFIDYLAGKI